MKITNIRKLKISATPYPKINSHIVSINDRDVGEVIRRITVPTGIVSLYYLMYLEIQTSGTLKIGETFSWGNIVFEVTGMVDGWYQASTPEVASRSIEIWSEQMEIFTKEIHCK